MANLGPRPMNFAERLLSNQVRTIKRKPRVDDVVVSQTSGRVFEVTEVLTDGYGHVYVYGVTSLEDGLPNAFKPGEVKALAVTEAHAARAYYASVRD